MKQRRATDLRRGSSGVAVKAKSKSLTDLNVNSADCGQELDKTRPNDSERIQALRRCPPILKPQPLESQAPKTKRPRVNSLSVWLARFEVLRRRITEKRSFEIGKRQGPKQPEDEKVEPNVEVVTVCLSCFLIRAILTIPESDPSDEYPLSQTTSLREGAAVGSQPPEATTTSQAPADSPPQQPSKPDTRTSHRKGGRPPARKGRVGRNQYTRDRDLPADTAAEGDGSPIRSQSRDGRNGDDRPNGHTQNGGSGGGNTLHNGLTESGTKPSRPRYMHPHRTSMNEMKRRVAAILEFISRTQVEMAGERTPALSNTTNAASAMDGQATAMLRSLAAGVGGIFREGGKSGTSTSMEKMGLEVGDEGKGKEGVFAELSSMEMMDVLTRQLVLWQREFGKWGDK